MNTSIELRACVLVLVCLLSTSSLGNEAVATTNFKTEGFYGNVDGETAKGLGASASVPLWRDFGLQIDGLGGEINPEDFYGVGLHAFWRNPGTGLFGLNATHTELREIEAPRLGLEGEYYLDRFTISAYGGYQSGDIDDSGYGALQGRYYVLDDLMVSAGAATSDDQERYAFAVEYQTPVHGLSLFANVATGEDDYDHAFIGLRFYFGGESKSLIRRHREDDPANNLFENILDTLTVLAMTHEASHSSPGTGGGGP
jgi:hypothetical protein